jgi:hypothetical protein
MTAQFRVASVADAITVWPGSFLQIRIRYGQGRLVELESYAVFVTEASDSGIIQSAMLVQMLNHSPMNSWRALSRRKRQGYGPPRPLSRQADKPVPLL